MAGRSETKGKTSPNTCIETDSISTLPTIQEEVFSDRGSAVISPLKRPRSVAFAENTEHEEEDQSVRFSCRPTRRSRRQAFYFNPRVENDPENNLFRHLDLSEQPASVQPGTAEADVTTVDLKARRINTLLGDNMFWSNLSEEVKTSLAKEFVVKRFEMGDTILEKGKTTKNFHVLESGTLSMGEKVFKEGDAFGEMTLIEGNFKPNDNVVAGDNLKLWVIPGAMYRYIQSEIYKKNEREAGGESAGSEEQT